MGYDSKNRSIIVLFTCVKDRNLRFNRIKIANVRRSARAYDIEGGAERRVLHG